MLDEEPGSYLDELNRQLLDAVRAAGAADLVDKPGGVFVRRVSQMTEDERILLQAAARVVLIGDRGPLASQLDRTERHPPPPPRFAPTREPGGWSDEPVEPPAGLLFANGLGGFTPDGREYCVLVRGEPPPLVGRNGPPTAHGLNHHSAAASHLRLPPAPWVNVVANPAVGFVASEAGSGFTWAVNSQANRLTPWSNDPVSDPPGEVIYLRDEETGEVWSPTPLPVPSWEPTLVRHGQGYTVYERNAHGLAHELTLFVPPEDPVKLIRLTLRATGSDRPRRLSATFYAEWVLGLNRDTAAMHVLTEVDEDTGALLAHNPFLMDFSGAGGVRRRRPAAPDGHGRPPRVPRPARLARRPGRDDPAASWPSASAARIDPCAAIQVHLELEPGAEAEVVFLIGEADDVETARALVRRYREPGAAMRRSRRSRTPGKSGCGTVQVRTPDPALDLLANRWLLYQVLACRYWGARASTSRAAPTASATSSRTSWRWSTPRPQIAREHILRAGGRMFLEGDVQHWWHPPTGRGVRTRISDDPAWLPFVAGYYIDATGDAAILDEPVAYLEGPAAQARPGGRLRPGRRRRPAGTALRALHPGPGAGRPTGRPRPAADGPRRLERRHEPRRRRRQGRERLAAPGSRSSSSAGSPSWPRRGATRPEPSTCRRRAGELAVACDQNAWDGAWYRRAYFDDGTPLGSAQQRRACQIDSLAQSWAVLSGAADPERARRAMEAVDAKLVDRQGRLIRLFTPPFDTEPLDPGYIKGYLPGIRENGGQYTHAAAWVVQAFAALGRGQLAAELLTLLNPIRHAEDPARRRDATRSSPTSSPATSTAGRPTSAAAAGPGTPARPPGSTGRSSSRSSASAATATA